MSKIIPPKPEQNTCPEVEILVWRSHRDFGRIAPITDSVSCWWLFYSLLLGQLSVTQTCNFHFTYPLLHRLDLCHEVTQVLCWLFPHDVTAASNSQSPRWLQGRFNIAIAVCEGERVIQKWLILAVQQKNDTPQSTSAWHSTVPGKQLFPLTCYSLEQGTEIAKRRY